MRNRGDIARARTLLESELQWWWLTGIKRVKHLTVAMMLVCCLGGPVRAEAFNTGNSAAADMANTMWEFMEWFLDGGNSYGGPYGYHGRYGDSPNHWYFPYSASGWYDNNHWPDPWSYSQVLDGVWLAASGEYWLIRGERFILVTPDGRRFDGQFGREGPFIHVRLAQGTREFAYRLWREMLVLQDVNGQSVTLRRIRRPQWSW